MDFQSSKISASAHGKHHIRYHIVLVVKYCNKALEGIVEEVKDVMYEIANSSHFKILALAVEPDHVHLVVRANPSISPLSIVKRLKQLSTNMLWGCCEKHLKRFFWKKRIVWTKGYYVGSLGDMSKETDLTRIVEVDEGKVVSKVVKRYALNASPVITPANPNTTICESHTDQCDGSE